MSLNRTAAGYARATRPTPPLDFSKRAKHRALRVAVFLRDDFTCQACGWRPDAERIPDDYDGRYTIDSGSLFVGRNELHIDHIKLRISGGSHHTRNLRTLCMKCTRATGRSARCPSLGCEHRALRT